MWSDYNDCPDRGEKTHRPGQRRGEIDEEEVVLFTKWAHCTVYKFFFQKYIKGIKGK